MSVQSYAKVNEKFQVDPNSEASVALQTTLNSNENLKALAAWSKVNEENKGSVELRVNKAGQFYTLSADSGLITKITNFFSKLWNEGMGYSQDQIRKVVEETFTTSLANSKTFADALKKEVKDTDSAIKKLAKKNSKLEGKDETKKKNKKKLKGLQKDLKAQRKELKAEYALAKINARFFTKFLNPFISKVKQDESLQAQFKDKEIVDAFSTNMKKIEKTTKAVSKQGKKLEKFVDKHKKDKKVGKTVIDLKAGCEKTRSAIKAFSKGSKKIAKILKNGFESLAEEGSKAK